ncbi:tRNA1(Val) (adenine(37)-N6)-methyltransferase [Providencia stuartii]|nr:tRNA1(Val) (adenine(37)-N6)-methyltransferase [Providencia stuartii]MBS7783021.1 tRNA1(Val) (adenine(37)-N6)-methyltransferase [Providencia thailandensis]QPN41900.1 tRNA1(Val) (adenine(37)-N6)-methyltransferase [Providencia sp. 2.29]EMA3642100.1 tRNA1(Val) (adenine(37)-N6)-methyltransferase [Providencia stuartii]EMD1717860.1 tRNA1(Val) (adenine(37)-N6)-methyltransferase [Providencia stuartii]MBG5904056.1 tRNA1(Val) (adenine(37)-N6)-methyltransferase [Providencia stuartii]
MNNVKKSYRKGGFTFKQFFVGHDRCAMKVGTDGVLLGAWAPVQQAKKALDIGSGSGLIALMLAQRNQQMTVDAVELDKAAAQQAQENFAESKWGERLQIFEQDITQFSVSRQKAYDLIVSNPPYFEPSVSCSSEQREQARYTATLTHQALLDSAMDCLTTDGLFCLVLPYDVGEKVELMAHRNGWFTAYRVNIRDKATTPFHRMLLGLKRELVEPEISTLVLKEADNNIYTEDFQRLIRDFYLKY